MPRFQPPGASSLSFFRDAEILADAVDAGRSGRKTLEDALASYQRERDAAVAPMFEMNCQLARLEPPPDMQQMFDAALRADQEQTNRFTGTVAGTVPIAEFHAGEPRVLAKGRQSFRLTGTTSVER